MSKEQIAAASAQPRTITVELDEPVKRGETSIASVVLTEPRGGALRGMSLGKLVSSSEYDEFVKLIPRISNPQITKADFEAGTLSAPDVMTLISETMTFFLPKKQREEIEAAE